MAYFAKKSALSAIIGVILAAGTAQAQSIEKFYKANNMIRIMVGFQAGDGYDTWARLLGRHMGRHIPGAPIFVVQNMPGAGSVNVANYLYNVAAKDGSVIGTFTRNLPSQALVDIGTAKFDPRNFGWIGSPEISSRICIVNAKIPVHTIEDLQKREVIMGGTGLGSAPSFLPLVINELLGTKFKVLHGYRGAGDVLLAMEQGETEGICQSYSSLMGSRAQWFRDGTVRVLFNTEGQRNPHLPNVPTVYEFIKDSENRQMMNFFTSSSDFGRPFVTPPVVPADRLQALRNAFDATVKDPAFLEDTGKQKLEVSVKSGAELEELVKDLFATPKHVIQRAVALVPNLLQ